MIGLLIQKIRALGVWALLALLLPLAGCGHHKAAQGSSPAGQTVIPGAVLDYSNGWYHPASGLQSVRRIAEIYKKDPELVAQLNHTRADATPAAGTMLYIPPFNNREKMLSVLTRIQQHPELVPRKPWSESMAAKPATATAAAAPVHEFKTDPSYKIKRADVPIVERSKRTWFHRAPKEPELDRAQKAAQANILAASSVLPAPTPASTLSSMPGGFQWPVRGQIITPFRDGWQSACHGIEIASNEGVPVRATRAGKVILAKEFMSYGKLIVIDHGDGFASTYGYNQAVMVREGDRVQGGQQIACVGRPSNGSSPRLYFQVRRNAVPVDPCQLLK